MTIQVILVDDEVLITDLLSNFLQQDSAIKVMNTSISVVGFMFLGKKAANPVLTMKLIKLSL